MPIILLMKYLRRNINRKPTNNLYLAWLFAHELIWGDVYEFNMHEGIEINEQDYAEEDETFNIFQTIDDYNMEECVPLLKGIG